MRGQHEDKKRRSLSSKEEKKPQRGIVVKRSV
jgi:hypothetical protein